MNVSHIIDKLREKYKDHEDYWTKEDILNENLNKSDLIFGNISSNFIKKDIQDNDVFGIYPYFIFVRCEKLEWRENEDILLYTQYQSYEDTYSYWLDFIGDCNDEMEVEIYRDTFYFYRVYTLVPMVGIRRKLFSEDEVYSYFKSDNKCKRNGFKYEYMFTSFLTDINNEFHEFCSRIIWDGYYPCFHKKNKLSFNEKEKILNYYTYSNFDWLNNTFTYPEKENISDFVIYPCETSLFWLDFLNDCKNEFETKLKLHEEFMSKNKNELTENINDFINKYDSDKNDKIDLFEEDNGFSELLKKHQKKIIEIDRSYIQNFVKLNEYIKTKKSNCIQTFNLIKEQLEENKENKDDIEFFKSSFEDLIQTYRLLVLHSLSMITSLVNDDMITFYEIYEILDKLGIFNSNHENLIEDKLSNIETSLGELISSINQMERNIVKGLDKLTYVTESSFKDLNKSIVKELQGIDSKLGFNNLLTSINTYQTYKLRK